jgi:hypothetical protein
MRTIFGREPAVFFEMLVAIMLGVLVTLRLDEPVHGAATAATVAIGGFLTAAFVSAERALPMLIGAIKAVFALVVTLGVDWDPTLETGVVLVVSALGAFFVRQNVVAPVSAPSRPLRVGGGTAAGPDYPDRL